MEKNSLHIKQLLIDFITGEIDPKEKKQVKAWINQSPENKKYFHHLRDTWEAAAVANKNHQLSTDKSWKRVNQKMNKQHAVPVKTIYFKVMRVAAIFLLAFTLGFFTDYVITSSQKDTQEIDYNITETPRGSRSKVLLADGTTVWLNADSKLTYPVRFSDDQRIVKLEGEGFFEVTRNEKAPFIVESGGIKIKALGTSFNVKAYGNEPTVETTLVEGLIAIQKENNENEILLKPNQKATFFKEDYSKSIEISDNTTTKEEPGKKDGIEKVELKKGAIIIDEEVETSANTSWKDNQWNIRNKTLADLAIELERKYDVSITFKSESLKGFRYSGTLRNESLEQVLSLISMTSPLTFSVEGKQVVFNEDPKQKARYRNLYNEKQQFN